MSDTNQFRIDSHKLHLHPERVARWLAGEDIAPIYLEISSSGACNHRCRFCSLDFMGYQKRFLDTGILKAKLGGLARIGVKSIMYAGDGEPLMHEDMPELTVATKEAGIDVAFTTNGVFLTPERAGVMLPHTSWIKISFNAGRPETYAKVHGARPDDYRQVLDNAAAAARLREKTGGGCTLGFQMVLLPENRDEAVHLAETVRDLGADYLVIKPHSTHRKSGKTAYKDLTYGDNQKLAEELAALDTPSFKTIFRHEAMQRRDAGRARYERCLALPFWAYVDGGGEVWTCSRHMGEDEFRCGNLMADPVEEIFGRTRREKMAGCATGLDIGDCHVDCRMDPINAYLWELTHPGPHVNFI